MERSISVPDMAAPSTSADGVDVPVPSVPTDVCMSCGKDALECLCEHVERVATAHSTRVLTPHPSHEEAPPRQKAKTEGSGDVSELAAMMKAMMKDVQEMKEKMATKEDMCALKVGVAEAKSAARGAVDIADKAMQAVSDVRTDVKGIKASAITAEQAMLLIEKSVSGKLKEMAGQTCFGKFLDRRWRRAIL